MDKQFPFDVTGELGEVQFFEEECPGVYFLSCSPRDGARWCSEFYLVQKDARAIPDEVKRMGRQLADNPGLLAYALEDVSGGQKIVAYEAARFRAIHGLPLEEGVTLRSLAVDGMETNPEYFGTYPVPSRTPWGYTLRHRAIDNGVYWIETEQSRVLAVCYILHDELSDFARRLATLERRDREEGLDETMGYLFFSRKSSCIPVFELMQARPQWTGSGKIRRDALENAIWQDYPDYAIHYNLQETAGQHDLPGLLLDNSPAELARSDDQMIHMTPDAGTEFCTLME